MSEGYPRIPETDYRVAMEEARKCFREIFQSRSMYGYAVYNDADIERCMDIMEQFAMKVRGKKITIQQRKRTGVC